MKRLIIAILLLSSVLCGEDIRTLSILHVNDLHAQLQPDPQGMGGFAYLAAAVRHEREGCASCIFLNAGDLVQGSPVSTIFHGVPVFEIANLLRLDAATLGNHEFDYGWKAVQEFARVAHFPLLSDNVRNTEGRLLTGKGYVILNVAGVRVGIIGVVMGDLTGNYVTAEEVGPWQVAPVAETLRRTAAEIKGRTDLIVALGHLSIDEGAHILQDAPEVSVAIVGHVHDGYNELKRNGNRYAVQTKAYGVELGRLDLRFDMTKHEIVSADWKRIPIDSHAISPAPDVAKEVAKWEAKVSRVVDVPIGEAKRALSKADLRPMIEAAMAEATGADFAFITTGDIRTTLPAGPLLARNIWNMLPFEDHIAVGRFKGKDLPVVITARHPVEPDREYSVAVTEFVVANQASPSQLSAKGMKFPITGPTQRDAMLTWVKNKKKLE